MDAIGAVGIARTFAYASTHSGGLEDAIKHFSGKLLRLEGLMKTQTGKDLARERTTRMERFLEWYHEETARPLARG